MTTAIEVEVTADAVVRMTNPLEVGSGAEGSMGDAESNADDEDALGSSDDDGDGGESSAEKVGRPTGRTPSGSMVEGGTSAEDVDEGEDGAASAVAADDAAEGEAEGTGEAEAPLSLPKPTEGGEKRYEV